MANGGRLRGLREMEERGGSKEGGVLDANQRWKRRRKRVEAGQRTDSRSYMQNLFRSRSIGI